MEKYCDHKSVGVILTNDNNEVALLRRARHPITIAPPAGHIDSHGSPEQAAVEEVREEIGVTIQIESLAKTAIANRRIENVCRRENGNYHYWTVYEARITDAKLYPDPDETNGAMWCSAAALRKLAKRTLDHGGNTADGLELVWVKFMDELGYLDS